MDGADTVIITRQEIITSLHEPEKFILAAIEVSDAFASQPRYVRGALDERDPAFGQTALQFNLKRLLALRGPGMIRKFAKILVEIGCSVQLSMKRPPVDARRIEEKRT